MSTTKRIALPITFVITNILCTFVRNYERYGVKETYTIAQNNQNPG